MRFAPKPAIYALFTAWFSLVSAARILEASALVPCLDSTGITARNFNVTYDDSTGSLDFDVNVNIGLSGYVRAQVEVYAYGFKIVSQSINPCSIDALSQLCPLTSGNIEISSSVALGTSITKQIPGVAFNVPDLDAYAIVKAYSTNSSITNPLACIRIEFRNTQTVEQTAVKWVTAVLIGLFLTAAVIFDYMGNAAVSQRISAVSVLLFQYFQSQALVNMEAVARVPPMAQSWSANVSWSIGIIYTAFMQKIFRWYVQATGGTPATNFLQSTIAVLPQKLGRRLLNVLTGRSPETQITGRVQNMLSFVSNDESGKAHANVFEALQGPVKLAASQLTRRDNELAEETYAKSSSLLLVLRGIKRVGYKSHIETTAIVLTALTWFVFICVAVGFIIGCAKCVLLLMRRTNSVEKYNTARTLDTYSAPLFRGLILRLTFMAFPSVMIFCLWEFVQRDSAAVIVIAVILLVSVLAVTLRTALRIIMTAMESKRRYGAAAYALFSDSQFRHRYGYIFAEYDSKHLMFIPIYMTYLFVKALFIAFAQSQGKVQGIAIFIIELVMLSLVCWRQPYLDRSTNIINIVMQVIITLNALFYTFFSNLFTQPLAVNSIMGVIYFVLNAAFSLVLLVYTLVYASICVFRKNPDTHIDTVKDDRHSFIDADNEWQPQTAAELLALGDAARADHDQSNVADVNWFEQSESSQAQLERVVPPRARDRRSGTASISNSLPTLDGPMFGEIDESKAGFGQHRATGSSATFDLRDNGTDSDIEGRNKRSSFKFW